MRTTLLLLMLLGALFVSQSEAGWFSKVVNTVKDTVKKVKDFVDEHKTLIGVATNILTRGKRSVGHGAEADNDEAAARELKSRLDEACPAMGIKSSDKLSKAVVNEVFDQSDENKDGFLDDPELNEFTDVMYAYSECITAVSKKK